MDKEPRSRIPRQGNTKTNSQEKVGKNKEVAAFEAQAVRVSEKEPIGAQTLGNKEGVERLSRT